MKRSIYAIILFLSIFLLFLSTTFTQGKSYIEDKNSSSINQEEDNFVKITGETIDRLKKKIWFELDDKALKSLKAEMDDDKLEVLKPLKNLKFSKEDLLEALTNINLTEEDITIIEKYTENKISSDRLTLLKELINIQYKEQEVRNKLEETGFTKSEIDVILGYAEVYSSQKETGERLYKWLNYTVKDGLIYNGVMTFEFDPQGYAWIGTGNDADPKFGGVSVLNPRGDFMSYTIKDGLADNRINDILFLPLKDEDLINPSKGGIWFATGYGLTKLDRKGKKKTYDKANSDLPDNRVSSLLLDDEGNLWVSTFGGGVAVIDQEGKWVIYNRSNGLAGNKVVPSFKDKDGNLWFGIWDGGLSCLEPGLFINEEILENLKKKIDKKKLENLKTLQNKNYSTAELIRNLKELKFEEKEIEIIVKQAKYSGKKWTNYSMGNSGLLSNSVTSIAQNPVDGKMWFATSEGLSTFDGKEWINYQAEKTPFVISNFITSLAFEKDGDLWIGYWGAGVTCLSKDETFRNFKAENSELISNYVGTVAIDRDNNKWFGTYSGFSVLHTEERDELTGDPVFKEFYSRIPFNGPFNLIGKPLWSDFYSFNGRKGIYKVLPENFNTSAYHWQIAGSEKEQRVSLRFALPIDHYGNVTWSYGAFWGEGVNLRQGGDMSYSITEDMMGNIWAEFSGIIRGADFLSYGYVTEFTKPIIDKNKDYPFPQKIPAEVEKYLLPGRYIPSDNPDIYKKAKSLVKESSSKDMYLTMKDILYSDLFRDMPYDYSINISEEQQNDITTTAKEVVVEEPFQTLKKNTGICWSKARLFCALCKAAGIPARLVVANGPYVWSEVWINEMGWIPVETSLPVYDYGAANRLAFPKVFLDTRIPVSSISGNDDDTKSIDWYPGVKASFDHVNPAELKELSKLSQAKILILEPAEKNEIENIPLETMIPMCEGLYFIASKSQEIPEEIKPPENLPKETTLKEIYDPSFEDKEIKNTEKIEKELYKTEEPDKFIETKKETTTVYSILIFNYKKELIDEIKFNELNKSVIIEKKNLVNLNIVPVKIGDYIILEIIKWELSKEKPEPQKTPTPTPGKEVTPSITPEPGKESNPVPGITPPPVPPGE